VKARKLNNKFAVVAVIVVILVAGLVIFSFRNPLSTANNSKSSASSFNTATGLTSQTSDSSLVPSLRLIDSMPLPNVGERFDHMSIDANDQLVFIVDRGNNSVDVADLTTEGVSHIIKDLNEPQGVYYVPQTHQLYVSNGGDGTVEIFNVRNNYDLVKTLSFSQTAADADNIRYDQSSGLLYVGYGEENQSGIGIINTTSDTVVGSIPLNGHPESFQVEQNGTEIFINVPTANAIEVADKVTRTVIASWRLPTNVNDNFPMALDERDNRLFVGFWSPPTLFVYNTQTGTPIANLSMPQDADDLYYDSASHVIVASCGQGVLYAIGQMNTDVYQPLVSLPTGPLARTSLFYPLQEEIFVAVPQHDGLSAQLLTFKIS
jgi:DNA-binding beta-propeller fold protein YncE